MANELRTSGVFSLGALSADNAFEAPSLDLNFDGQASSFTRATTSPTDAKANGDQLATAIVTQNKTGTVQSKHMGPNGKLVNGYVDNVLPHSSIGSWTLQSNMTATASSVTDPLGGTGAFQIADNDPQYWRYAEVTGLSVSAGTQAVLSVYVHASANSTSQIGFNIKNTGGTDQYPRMGFTNNVPSSLGNGGSYYQVAGTDWYRWEFPFTTGATSIEFYPAVAAASSTGYVTVFGVQLETGSGTASQLVQTSGASVADQVARVEYDASGNPLGLLVEEARTNLWPSGQSNFGNATAGGGSTASTTAVTAPDGTTNNIWAITESGTAGSHHVYTGISGISASTAYTASYYLKKGSEDYGFVYFEGAAFSSSERVWFDLVNGTVGTETGSSVGHISDAGNGWYRCSVTTTSGTTLTTAYASVGFSSTDGNFNSSGASATTGYYWGMQVEAGEGPTSLIYDDTASSVTRPADDISVSTSDFGYLSSTGTSAIDVTVASKTEGNDFPNIFQFQGATDQDRIFLRSNQSAANGGIVDTQHRDGGTSTNTSVLSAPLTWPYTLNFAMAHEGAEMRKALDGTLQAPRTLNQAVSNPHSTLGLGISLSNSARVMNGHIRRFTYWPRAISDASLIAYTTTTPPTIDIDRPMRRWGGMTGRSLVSGDNVPTTGVLSLPELLQVSYGTAGAWDGSGAELLLVAGGGGGGGVVTASPNIGGGGGGAGAYYPLSAQTFAFNTTYTFTVGAGGAGNTGAGQGSSGGATTLVGGAFNLSSPGGGGGGAFGSAASNGASGGSGGGAGWNSTGGSATAGAGQFGNAGGSTSGLSKAGGGGGAGSAGAISGSNYDGADGGSGKTWAIDGVALAGGGGAGGWQGQGTGYVGQGQEGGANGSGGTATANTGGGGGGGRRAANQAGTNGASGVIKVWVPQAGYSGYTAGTPANVTASAVTYSGAAGTLLTVTGTTTITFS